MKTLLRNMELYFSLGGLLVILFTVVLISPRGYDPWVMGAITVLLAGMLQALTIWLVQRRQRRLRHKVFHEVQQMLKDLINNQLTVIQTMSNLREANPAEANRACDYITRSVNTITAALHELSEDSLQRWQRQYERQRPLSPVGRS